MPLFEYACRACGHHFECLAREGHPPRCPSCRGEDLEKLLSVFAVGGAGRDAGAGLPAPGPCGACGDPRGPGSCSIN